MDLHRRHKPHASRGVWPTFCAHFHLHERILLLNHPNVYFIWLTIVNHKGCGFDFQDQSHNAVVRVLR